MRLISGLTDAAKQEFVLQVEDFGRVKFLLTYCETQKGWFMDIDAGIKIINGIRLVNSLNMLRTWRHILGFGLSVQTSDGKEATTVDAFSSLYCSLVLLSNAEVLELEEVYLQ